MIRKRIVKAVLVFYREAYLVKFDRSMGIERIYYSDRYGFVVLYTNGFCDLETSILGLGNGDGSASIPHYYKWIDEEHLYIGSLLGYGMLFNVDENNILYIDYNFFENENLEKYETKVEGISIAVYIDPETGNGYSTLGDAEGVKLLCNFEELTLSNKKKRQSILLCLFFLFFPHKVVIDGFTAVNQDILTGAEFVGYGEKICPFGNFFGCCPAF